MWVGGFKFVLEATNSGTDGDVRNETSLAWIDESPMLPFEPGTSVTSDISDECFSLKPSNGALLGAGCRDLNAVICETNCQPGTYFMAGLFIIVT